MKTLTTALLMLTLVVPVLSQQPPAKDAKAPSTSQIAVVSDKDKLAIRDAQLKLLRLLNAQKDLANQYAQAQLQVGQLNTQITDLMTKALQNLKLEPSQYIVDPETLNVLPRPADKLTKAAKPEVSTKK